MVRAQGTHHAPVLELEPSMRSVNTMWEREECSLSWVHPTDLFSMASLSSMSTWAQQEVGRGQEGVGAGGVWAWTRSTLRQCHTVTLDAAR